MKKLLIFGLIIISLVMAKNVFATYDKPTVLISPVCSPSPTLVPTVLPTPIHVVTVTATPSATISPTLKPTASPTAIPTVTPTISPTPTSMAEVKSEAVVPLGAPATGRGGI